MVAPIALYPDQLLVQVLMASTYPLEVVQAERWVADPKNEKLKGDQLTAALENVTWDPSVKSLVPFPPVLKMMSDKIDWTQRLGDAFLAQQQDVMSAVQRLREQAQSSGNLKTTKEQTVIVQKEPTTEKETIIIQPSDPQVVYVPSYNPTVVYGSWPYPAYPPVYYPPPPSYYPTGAALFGFAAGVAVGGALWGWGNADWGHGDVNINASRYNNINTANIRSGRANQLSANSNTWRHDPSHRAGVAYRDPGTRQAYQRPGASTAAGNRGYRGYDGSQRGAAQAANRQATNRSAGAGSTIGQRQAGSAGAGRPQAGASRQASNTPGAGAGRAGAGAGRTGGAGGGRQGASQRQPSAFQGIGSGSDVRAQANRGRSSRQSAGAFSSRGGAGSSARAGGGMRGGGGGGRGGGGGGGGRRGR